MKKTVGFITLLLCCALLGYAQQQYHNKLWGFSMSRPEGWLELDAAYTGENIEEYDFSEEQLQKLLDKRKGLTQLLALSKRDPKTNAGVIPTIKINGGAANGMNQEMFFRAMQNSFDGIIKLLDNARFDREPKSIVLNNGIPAILGVVSFDLKHDGITYRARSFIYAVLRKNYFLQFSFTDTDEEDCSKLYKELEASISFDKK